MATTQGGKKGRKHGRSKRKLSNQRYVAETRWVKNAKLRAERHAKRVAKKKAHLAARGLVGYSERRASRNSDYAYENRGLSA